MLKLSLYYMSMSNLVDSFRISVLFKVLVMGTQVISGMLYIVYL